MCQSNGIYKSESWQEAIIAYKAYAENANWLANLLSQCLEPFYSANSDERKRSNYSFIMKLEPIEDKARELREERNIAYAKIGISYKRMGDIQNAVVYLYKGLEYLRWYQEKEWELVKNELIDILGFKN